MLTSAIVSGRISRLLWGKIFAEIILQRKYITNEFVFKTKLFLLIVSDVTFEQIKKFFSMETNIICKP